MSNIRSIIFLYNVRNYWWFYSKNTQNHKKNPFCMNAFCLCYAGGWGTQLVLWLSTKDEKKYTTRKCSHYTCMFLFARQNLHYEYFKCLLWLYVCILSIRVYYVILNYWKLLTRQNISKYKDLIMHRMGVRTIATVYMKK